MADVEKVKNGLVHCTAWNGMGMCQPKSGYDCPYDDEADCKYSLHIDAMSVIEELQAEIERLQPKKGKWLEYAGDQKCSVCGSCYSDLHPEYSRTPFCPHCGAKMEEGDVE